MHLSLAVLVGLTFLGLLAGAELAVHHGIGAPPAALPQQAQLLLRQAQVRRLRVLMPALFFPSFLFAVGDLAWAIHRQPLWPRCLAVAALLVWIVLRIVRTVPVNSATLEWNPEAPPADWRDRVARSERSHVVAAWATVMAFVLLLAVHLASPHAGE